MQCSSCGHDSCQCQQLAESLAHHERLVRELAAMLVFPKPINRPDMPPNMLHEDCEEIGKINNAAGNLYACVFNGRYFWGLGDMYDYNAECRWEEISESLYTALLAHNATTAGFEGDDIRRAIKEGK